MNKFKREQIVSFKDDFRKFRVIRYYKSGETFKYDLISLDGKCLISAMPEDTLVVNYDKLPEIMIEPEAANLEKYQKDNTESQEFPEGMIEELIRLGKKKN